MAGSIWVVMCRRSRQFGAVGLAAWLLAGRLVMAMVMVGVGVGGCAPSRAPSPMYPGDVYATYRFRTLSTELGEDVRVPAAIKAGEAALYGRGYTIRTVEATEDSGRVVGLPAHAGVLEEVVIWSYLTARGTKIKIRVKPLGGENRARAILDDMLGRLGV